MVFVRAQTGFANRGLPGIRFRLFSPIRALALAWPRHGASLPG